MKGWLFGLFLFVLFVDSFSLESNGGDLYNKVNVRDFGAKGDGRTDDTQVFQTILNIQQERLVVWIPNGTYAISSTLKISGNQSIALIGEDPSTTVIRMQKLNTTCSLDVGCVMLWAVDGPFLVLSTTTWDGNNLVSSIFRHDSAGTESVGMLSDLVLTNAPFGIVSTNSENNNCEEWEIMNCNFDVSVGPCFHYETANSDDGAFTDSRFGLLGLIFLFIVLFWARRQRIDKKRENDEENEEGEEKEEKEDEIEYLSTPFSFFTPSLSLFDSKSEDKGKDVDLELEFVNHFPEKEIPKSKTPSTNEKLKASSQTIFSYSFASGSLLPGFSASGGNSGTIYNLVGKLVPSNSPRIDFGTNFFSYGDPASKNLVLQSNSFTLSPWVQKTNGSSSSVQITPNAGISPDGNKNATQLDVSGSLANFAQAQVQQIVNGLVIGQVYTASIYVQGTVGGETLVLQIQTADSPYDTLSFSGIIATTNWNRYSCTFLATTDSVYFSVGTNMSAEPLTSSPQSGGTVLIYGPQLEPSSSPSSFISTSSSPSSRPSSLQHWFAPSSGLLVEPSRTNIVLNSNSFDLPPWKIVSDGGATVNIIPNGGTSPLGQPCVQATFSAVSSSQIGSVQQQITNLTPGATYKASVWVQGINGGETFYLYVQLGGAPYTVLGSVLISAQPFWQRFSCTFVSSGSSIYLGIGGNTTSPLLSISGGSVLLFNAQVELGPWESSDIITSNSPVTRSADSISFTIPASVDTLNYTFVDGTVQSISVSPGVYTIPTNLNRAKISAITGSSTPSTPITSVTFGTPYKYNNGYPFKVVDGDTWSNTWADDDVIYTQSCDSTNLWAPGTPTSNFCFSTLSDTTNSLTGTLLNSMTIFGNTTQKGPDGATWKANGTICVDGVLYTWISRQTYGVQSNGYIQKALGGQLIKSVDHGKTFSPVPPGQALPFSSPMFPTSEFSAPEFIQFGGRDYKNNVVHNSDNYVYAISNDGSWNNGNYMILGRVARSAIGNQNASDWQFYQGGDGMIDSNWSSLSSAYKIIYGNKQCGITGAQYLPFCKRYIMLQWYYPSIPNNGTDNVQDSLWNIFESPTPWGPWTMIQTYEWNKEPGLGLYNPNVMPKSISFDNGQNLIVTTCGNYFNGDIKTGDYTLTLVSVQVNT